jgi:putative peptide zinc metalloprotease protein
VAVQIRKHQIEAVNQKIRRTAEQLADLEIRSPQSGQWVSPEIDLLQGSFIHKGQKLGLVATMDDLVIKAAAMQDEAGPLLESAADAVTVRIKGQPDQEFSGRVKLKMPMGLKQLSSPALGSAAGGPIAIKTDDRTGNTAAEAVFEIQVTPDPTSKVRLLPEQRVIIRFDTPAKPLLIQGKRWLDQLLQRRFHV